jgi:hypothetical protein
VAGVAGGAFLSSIDILLMAISGAIAGAVSIVAGEFVATTKSQNEVCGDKLRSRGDIFKPIAVMKMDKVSSLLALIGISNQQQGLT